VLDDMLARAGDPDLSQVPLLCRILTAELAMRAVDAALD
jgi:hypothetical protein